MVNYIFIPNPETVTRVYIIIVIRLRKYETAELPTIKHITQRYISEGLG